MEKKRFVFATIFAVLAVFGVVLAGCEVPAGSGTLPVNPSVVDKATLDTAISTAKAAKAGVMVDTDAANVPSGTQWVTQAVMDALNAAITAAEAVSQKAGATEAEMSSAVTALNSAIATFNGAKKAGEGEGTLADTTTLDTAINAAETAKAGVAVDTSAANVPSGTQWVTEAVMDALTTAIATAEAVTQNAGTTQQGVTDAVTALNEAVSTFTNAKSAGTKTVGSGNGGGNDGQNPPASNLTADVGYLPTDMDMTLNDQSGAKTANQTWGLVADAFGDVYFAVERKPGQTITVSGADAAQVAMAGAGEAVDGVTQGETGRGTIAEVFTVATLVVDEVNRLDTQFGGGEFAFTLNVAEEGKDAVAVAVAVTVPPDELTGTAVFTVAANGALTRVAELPQYTISQDGQNTVTTTENAAEGLLDALIWVDRNAAADTEYLIRVEKDEALPIVILTAGGTANRNVTFRLRGVKERREISHDKNFVVGSTAVKYYHSSLNNGSGYEGFINVGIDKSTLESGITLQLEDKITLKGREITSTDHYRNVVQVGQSANKLVMKDGSQITGYKASCTLPNYTVIYLKAKANNKTIIGTFCMEGGEIIGNDVSDKYPNILFSAAFEKNLTPDTYTFIKTGGYIGNNKSNEEIKSIIQLGNNANSQKIITITDPNKTYIEPAHQ
jgi:hypothetical protein